jgi:hypothetical protein
VCRSGAWGVWGGFLNSDGPRHFPPQATEFFSPPPPPSGSRLCFVHRIMKFVSSDVSKARASFHYKFEFGFGGYWQDQPEPNTVTEGADGNFLRNVRTNIFRCT